ncbi:MAG TPA: NAD(P)/FAD-dependent oxidoreductase [Allocoleopsis sp.]
MSFDYDLVILGGSAVARYAAAKASHWGARVALVESVTTPGTALLGSLYDRVLAEAGHLLYDWQKTQQLWLYPPLDPETTPPFDRASWQSHIREWTQDTVAALADRAGGYSLSTLAVAGVDVRVGEGRFEPVSRRSGRSVSSIVFQVNGSSLKSRAYLLAPPSHSAIPDVVGLADISYWTVEQLATQAWQVPDRLMIVGGSPLSLELAQLFNRLGTQVTVVVSQPRLLPYEEAEVITLLQAMLEAEGIEIIPDAQITQVKQLGQQIWVQAGNHALETDQLLLTGQAPLLALWNLDAVGVAMRSSGVLVNSRLQTTHPQIYACAEALGGYALPHLAQLEADIALRNALFFPTSKINYRSVPWTIFTHPTFARVGVTETQARRFYGDSIVVLRHPLTTGLKAQIQQETIGVGKLIVRRNGEILGASLLGAGAAELISPIALAMQHRIKLQAMARSAFVSPAFSEVLAHLIQQWQQCRLPNWQKELLESWFNFRRA